MNCEAVQDLLADYSVNGLDSKTCRQLKAHLLECSTCTYEFELLWRVVSFVESAAPQTLPLGLWEGIEARIRQADVRVDG